MPVQRKARSDDGFVQAPECQNQGAQHWDWLSRPSSDVAFCARWQAGRRLWRQVSEKRQPMRLMQQICIPASQ